MVERDKQIMNAAAFASYERDWTSLFILIDEDTVHGSAILYGVLLLEMQTLAKNHTDSDNSS